MTIPVHSRPVIYHIVHLDRLPSITSDMHLWSDAVMAQRGKRGTSIGLSTIKDRRLRKLTLSSHLGLHIGECVPFYFCPRSVMLYVIYKQDHHELIYRGGQGPIIHLVAEFHAAVDWADANKRRWAFTTSNAGSRYFVDYSDLGHLHRIDWTAVQARSLSGPGIDPAVKEGKQAEFLIEYSFPWEQISRVGVYSQQARNGALQALRSSVHQPTIEIKPEWYY